MNHCNHLTICLHNKPTKQNKLKPILSLEERTEILESIKYIDEIETYETEDELDNLLKTKKFDVRILGSDYTSGGITGEEHSKKTVYVNRDHGWSTTKYKKLIFESFKETE